MLESIKKVDKKILTMAGHFIHVGRPPDRNDCAKCT